MDSGATEMTRNTMYFLHANNFHYSTDNLSLKFCSFLRQIKLFFSFLWYFVMANRFSKFSLARPSKRSTARIPAISVLPYLG